MEADDGVGEGERHQRQGHHPPKQVTVRTQERGEHDPEHKERRHTQNRADEHRRDLAALAALLGAQERAQQSEQTQHQVVAHQDPTRDGRPGNQPYSHGEERPEKQGEHEEERRQQVEHQEEVGRLVDETLDNPQQPPPDPSHGSDGFTSVSLSLLGKTRKKCRNAAGRTSNDSVPVLSTTPSTQEYEAGRSRQTRNSRNSVQSAKKTRLGPPADSSSLCSNTYRPMKKKRKPEKQA